MPEDLPTPKKSLKQLEKENNKSLKQRFRNWQKINLCVIINLKYYYNKGE